MVLEPVVLGTGIQERRGERMNHDRIQTGTPEPPRRQTLRIYHRDSTFSTVVESDGVIVGELLDGVPNEVRAEFWRAMAVPRWIVNSNQEVDLEALGCGGCKRAVPPYWNTAWQCTSETCHRPLPCPVHDTKVGP